MNTWLTLVLWVTRSAFAVNTGKFLIVSQPKFARISYMDTGEKVWHPLVDTGLKNPLGIAVDQSRRLYVADIASAKVFWYQLEVTAGKLLVSGQQSVAAEADARWVAVDGVGNVFFSIEQKNEIATVSPSQIAKQDARPHTMYKVDNLVRSPSGIAVDGFFAYWGNKAMALDRGSLIKGTQSPPDSPGLRVQATRALSKNVEMVYGVCMSLNNVYYTSQSSFVYGIKKNGGAVATITDKLQSGRGCVWDNDGSIYMADRGAGALISFPANMDTLGPSKLVRVAELEDPYGVAFLNAAPAAALAFLLALI